MLYYLLTFKHHQPACKGVTCKGLAIMESIKLLKRQGMHRVYESDKGFIWVGVCTNPAVYVEPGYYVSPEKNIPSAISSKRYSSAISAARAAYKSI